MSVAPPHPKLPVLNRLRAFEAAARCGGFRVAAAELCVTPAAVSHSIRALEVWAGVTLFVRQSNGVAFSGHGTGMARGWREQLLTHCWRATRSVDPQKTAAIIGKWRVCHH
ncbi:MAG TPA: LysR family transcriptional regulator [Roseibacterium sp.]|nr:LysR family transcriptional regulator [Roseibacterium sp.]